jgi:hypothetical protein
VAKGAILDAAEFGAVDQNGGTYLDAYQNELVEVGLLGKQTGANSASPAATEDLDVTTEEGLTRLHMNILFFESVFHGAIFATREYSLPIAMPMTSQFADYIRGDADAASGVSTVDDAINKFCTTSNVLRKSATPIFAQMAIMFDTGSGYNGAVELSDGPFYNYDAWQGGADHIKLFQAEVLAARTAIQNDFGTNFAEVGKKGERFLPGYYYPVDTPKPSGYLLCETVYI